MTSTSENNSNTFQSTQQKWSSNNITLFDTFIFDCDGVLWLQNNAIPGAKSMLNKLLKLNKKLIFLSNNSTKEITEYKKKIGILFNIEIGTDQIFTSSVATAVFVSELISSQVQKNMNVNVTILLVGSLALKNTIMNELKFNHLEKQVNILWTKEIFDSFSSPYPSLTEIADMPLDENVSIIVAGFYIEHGYKDVSLVCRYLHEMKNEVHFIGTNDDCTYPAKNGIVLAGTGSLMASMKVLTPKPMIMCGKPHKILFELIEKKHGQMIEMQENDSKKQKRRYLDVSKCLMIGDRISTDIAFAKNTGMKSLLVMSGVTNETLLKQSEMIPDFILPSVKYVFDD